MNADDTAIGTSGSCSDSESYLTASGVDINDIYERMFNTRPSIGHRMTSDWKRSGGESKGGTCVGKNRLEIIFRFPGRWLNLLCRDLRPRVFALQKKRKKEKHAFIIVLIRLYVLTCPCTFANYFTHTLSTYNIMTPYCAFTLMYLIWIYISHTSILMRF